jgi:hypothetical protein
MEMDSAQTNTELCVDETQVYENCVQLLKENHGTLSRKKFWNHYRTRFRLKTKQWVLRQHFDFILNQHPEDFQTVGPHSQVVYLKMAGTGKNSESIAREAVRDQLCELLRENGGHWPLSTLWQEYTRRFKVSVKKKELGISKMTDIFDIYPEHFEVISNSVFLRAQSAPSTSQGKQAAPGPSSAAGKRAASGPAAPQGKGPSASQGKPAVPGQPLLPAPIKPLWGAGTGKIAPQGTAPFFFSSISASLHVWCASLQEYKNTRNFIYLHQKKFTTCDYSQAKQLKI